jgi:hypothetical protein
MPAEMQMQMMTYYPQMHQQWMMPQHNTIFRPDASFQSTKYGGMSNFSQQSPHPQEFKFKDLTDSQQQLALQLLKENVSQKSRSVSRDYPRPENPP